MAENKTQMQNIINDLNIPSDYKEAISYGVSKIRNLVPFEIVFIGLCGSAAREDILENFSDVDLLFIHNGSPLYDIKERFYYKNIKIGLTILPKEQTSPQYLDRKPWYFFRCFNKGLYKSLWGDSSIIPYVSMSELYSFTTGSVNINSLEKSIITENEKGLYELSIKHCHTLMKNLIFLYFAQEVEGYKNIYSSFYELFKNHFSVLPTICDMIDSRFNPQEIEFQIKKFIDEYKTYTRNKKYSFLTPIDPNKITYKTSKTFQNEDCFWYKQIPLLTSSINDIYETHEKWYFNVFIEELKREISPRAYVLAYIDDVLLGVALLTNKDKRKKICCLYVSEIARGKKIGAKLIEKSIETLECAKPTLHVSALVYPQLKKIFDDKMFTRTFIRKGVNKQGVDEYYFNETKYKE